MIPSHHSTHNPKETRDDQDGPSRPASPGDARHLRRRHPPGVILAGVAAGMLVAAGCGVDDESKTGTEGARGPSGAFPVTIQHKYGTTDIPSQPTRVVTAGFNDSDYALAFGVRPVGVRDFIGPFPEETRPWAQEALAGAKPEKVSGPDGALNFEMIAALRPDLILAYSYLEEAEYKRLAPIAPTVVEPSDGSLWREHTLVVGRALGQKERAEQLVADVERRFADAKEQHPEFVGAAVHTAADEELGVGSVGAWA